MESYKKIIRGMLLTSATLCLATFSFAQSSDQAGKVSAADKQFAMKAAQGGMAEVELGKLAADKGKSDDVKQFGQHMVDDHSKANDQLKSVAQQKNITLPTDLSAKDKALKNKLSGMSGDQFDKAYMAAMVKDHKTDIAEFQKEANSGKDSDIKNFASQTLPTLKDHLKMAQDANAKVSGTSSKKSSTSASNMQH